MSPRDVYMLGFTLFWVGWSIPFVLMAGHGLVPALIPSSAGIGLWPVGLAFLGGFIKWLARCNQCDLSLIWRYVPDAPPLFRYWSVNWLPPKACSRCGDPLE